MRDNKFIKWVDGRPEPAGPDNVLMTKQQYEALTPAVLSAPYEPMYDNEGHMMPGERNYQRPDGSWMTVGEVIQVRRALAAAHGDKDARKEIEDRWLGKPKQSVENINVTGTIEEWIEAAMRNEKQYVVDGDISEVTILGIETNLNDPPDTADGTAATTISVPQTEPDMSWL